MIKFVLNNQSVETDLPKGTTVLDFARYHKNLKGTKIGCREGDCGACTILVGELAGETVKYRTQTSCLMPLANARGKHIVTIEGINRDDGTLTPVQSAIIEESGTQCGFCTVGFVMSLTNFCIDDASKSHEAAVSAIDGNICRCTGYKSIERACAAVVGGQRSAAGKEQSAAADEQSVIGKEKLRAAILNEVVPEYFAGIKERLAALQSTDRAPTADCRSLFLGGGTDLYVQRPEEMVRAEADNLFDNSQLRFITETEEFVEIGASTVVTDLLESGVFQRLFPNLYRHLKLVSSTPIRNMATIAGNFVNASPIGDMTAWFLALDAEIELSVPPASADGSSAANRTIALKNFYLGYKQLAKAPEEFITKIRFGKDFTHFNFEKVSKRTYLDIATVNTAVSLKMAGDRIENAHVSAGGVAPTPLYLRQTSERLRGQKISEGLIEEAAEILRTEVSPISDVRGTAEYKRLLLRQLFTAHFLELFEANFK